MSVTPDGATTPHRTSFTNGYTATFTVTNTGTNSDTYTIMCEDGVGVTCTGTSTSSLSLAGGEWGTVDAYYNVGAAGTGRITLLAQSNFSDLSTDYGYYNVPIDYAAPIVSLAPMNSGVRVVDPFDVVITHSTPAYQSLGTARSVTLVYNSSTVKPTPVVVVDVSNLNSPYPTTYSMQVQLASNGVRLHLLNGSDSVFYVAGTTTTSRLVAAIDANANGLGTGAYDVNVTVTANYSVGPRSTTVAARLLVENETGSLFGAGWQLAGIQRVNAIPGSYSVLVTNGDGSISFFRRDCSTCAFISPQGDPTRLFLYNPDTSIAYRRAAPDSSAVDYRSDGRMVRLWSGELTRAVMTLTWSGTQLTSIQDLIGKRTSFGYTGPYSASGKLQTITDPAGRVTIIWTDSQGLVYKITDPDSAYSTFGYDASLRLTGVTDRGGSTTNLTYDAISRLDTTRAATITDYAGNAIRPTTVTAACERLGWQPAIAGATSSAPKLNVRADTIAARLLDAVGSLTRIAYDRFGGPTRVVDPLGQATTIGRDTLGQVTSVSEPNGHLITNTYTGYLLSSTQDNATGHTTNYVYNSFSRVITITGNAGTVRTDIYYQIPYFFGGDFGPVDSVYVGNTGTYAAPSGGFMVAQYLYNHWGQDSMITDGASHVTTFLYSDTAHYVNLTQVTDPSGRVTSKTHYASAGRPDTVWIPANGAMVPSVLTYDQMNRTLAIRDPLGLTTQYNYGPMNLNRVTDPKGQVYRFDYNALGWATTQHDLGDTTRVDSLRYDAAGRLRTLRTRRGDAISLTYDALGRVLTRSGPGFPVDSMRYGPTGRWMVAVNANAYDSLAYDVAGRVVYSLERLAGDSSYVMTFTYDTLGRLLSRSAPRGGNAVTFGYNRASGTLDTLCAAGACSIWGNRDAENLAHSRAFGTNTAHGWVMNMTTDSAHRVVSNSFGVRAGGYSVAQLDTAFRKTFRYDTLGRLVNEWPYASPYGYGGYRYRYDSDGRLLNACADQTTVIYPIGLSPSCPDEYGEDPGYVVVTGDPGDTTNPSIVNAYRYDQAGNRRDSLAGAVIGAGNRLAQFKGYALAYDLNGDLVSKKGSGGAWGADSTLFTWDATGALTQVERWTPGAAHTIITYAYDALGRRVAKTVGSVTERYVHDGDQVVQDIDGATHAIKSEYGWAPGADNLLYIRTPTWTAGVITDPRVGTVRGLATAEYGQILKQYPASYWGQVTPDTGYVVRFRHAAREYDAEAGLYYNRARYYDPQLGRFISEDPIGIAGGLNLYAYAGNDPVNDQDPSGLCHKGKPHSEDPPGTVCMPPITSNPPDGSWSDPYCGNWESYSDPVCEIKRSECTGHWVMGPGVCVAPEDPWSGNEGGGPGDAGVGDIGKEAEQKCTIAILDATASLVSDALFVRGIRAAYQLSRQAVRLETYAMLRSADGARMVARGVGIRSVAIRQAARTMAGEEVRDVAMRNPATVGSFALATGEDFGLPDLVPIWGTLRAGNRAINACFHPGE